jgi:hypothetical protein
MNPKFTSVATGAGNGTKSAMLQSLANDRGNVANGTLGKCSYAHLSCSPTRAVFKSTFAHLWTKSFSRSKCNQPYFFRAISSLVSGVVGDADALVARLPLSDWNYSATIPCGRTWVRRLLIFPSVSISPIYPPVECLKPRAAVGNCRGAAPVSSSTTTSTTTTTTTETARRTPIIVTTAVSDPARHRPRTAIHRGRLHY